VHRDPGNVPVSARHLAGMQSAADVQAGPTNGIANVAGAANRSRRAVERRKDSVSRAADELTAVGHQRAPDGVLESVEKLAPAPVTDFTGPLGRTGNIHEEDGRENAIFFRVVQPGAGDELLDRAEQVRVGKRPVVCAVSFEWEATEGPSGPAIAPVPQVRSICLSKSSAACGGIPAG